MRLAIAIALVSLLLLGSSHATDAVQRADQLMQNYAGEVPGAALLVLKDGKPLLRKGYGLANLEQHTPVTPQTDFRLASVSKQFTAAAILLLAEDGKLSLDDPVRHWLPSLPAANGKVTLRQLLDHTGGLIDYEDLIPPGQTAQLNDQDVLRMLSATPNSYFAPGSSYRYSNSGYVLLGLVVEKASGQSLPLFLRTRIFQPLHMDHTLLYAHDGATPIKSGVPNRAYGHSRLGGHWKRTDQDLTSATRGDGGIYSSIDDLAKWDAALYDDRLLSDASRKLAFSPHGKSPASPIRRSTVTAGASPATPCGIRARASVSAT
jgi:CubicO group peptidase (beta-lactamase class C family)